VARAENQDVPKNGISRWHAGGQNDHSLEKKGKEHLIGKVVEKKKNKKKALKTGSRKKKRRERRSARG